MIEPPKIILPIGYEEMMARIKDQASLEHSDPHARKVLAALSLRPPMMETPLGTFWDRAEIVRLFSYE